MRTLIVTVGTSLLTNRDEEGTVVKRPWAGWRRGSPMPELDLALEYLRRANPVQASAETNTLQALPLAERDRIAWLHSDTEEGKWCAEVLKDHFKTQGYPGDLYRISGLAYREATFTGRGLRSLLEHVFTAIRQAGPDHVVLCATGGFKAEIAFTNLVGLLMQVPVCYIHEHFQELVWLPRLPVDWDLSVVEENVHFFQWIDSHPRPTAEVENWLKAQPTLRPLVTEGSDGNTYLSPAGDLLFRAHRERAAAGPRAMWPPPSVRSPQQKNRMSSVSHRRPDGWEQFVRRLTEVDCVEAVRYDDSGLAQGGRTRVYRRAPEEGGFGVTYCHGDRALPLWIETTARGESQLGLVLEWFERQFDQW